MNWDFKWMVVKKIQIHLFSQVFKTKVTTSLKSIKLCKFVWHDVDDYIDCFN